MPARAQRIESWPADKVERRPIKALIPAARNARTHTDAQVGRLVDYLEQSGQLDNTIVFYCADNGASGQGGRALPGNPGNTRKGGLYVRDP